MVGKKGQTVKETIYPDKRELLRPAQRKTRTHTQACMRVRVHRQRKDRDTQNKDRAMHMNRQKDKERKHLQCDLPSLWITLVPSSHLPFKVISSIPFSMPQMKSFDEKFWGQ